VAATVVLPAVAGTGAQVLLEADVAPGGRLVCALPPVVVTGRAAVSAAALLRLVGDAQVRLDEHVRLGRHAEPGGRWCGRVDVTRDGVPLLRQTTRLGEDPEDGLRVLRSVLDTGDSAGAPGEHDGSRRSVVMDLARGGTLTVTLG
jgi:hypothetical protein